MGKDYTTAKPSFKDIQTSKTAELRFLYEHIIGQAPPKRAGRDFIIGNLVWSIQADKLKLSPSALRKQLYKKSRKAIPELTIKHRPGTCLIREWHGRVYEVRILDKGYMWNGRTFTSLTRIAAEITGTWRSGPLFFGLRKRP